MKHWLILINDWSLPWLPRCSLAAVGAWAAEVFQDSRGHFHHLHDDFGGSLPCRRGLPQQHPCRRRGPVHTCLTVHTRSGGRQSLSFIQEKKQIQTLSLLNQDNSTSPVMLSIHTRTHIYWLPSCVVQGCVYWSGDPRRSVCQRHPWCGSPWSFQSVSHQHQWVCIAPRGLCERAWVLSVFNHVGEVPV